MTYYRISFPNPGDGTQFSDDDLVEMEKLHYGLEDAEEAGVLIPVTEDLLSRAEWEATTQRCEHGYDRGHIIGGASRHSGSIPWIMVKANNDPIWCSAAVGEDNNVA